MELIRGKTFIKSYAQHPPEKVLTVVYKGRKNVELQKNVNDCDIRGKTFIKSYTQNPPEKVPTVVHKEKKNVVPEKNVNECYSKKNAVQTQRMSNGICTKEADNVRCPRFLRKSKTHDCVIKDEKPEKLSGQMAPGRIPNSLSSPGLVEDQGGKRNDIEANRQATCKQTMIDYRNFVPQMPFVPSVAKSLPRKRISLRKSRKSLRNIFNLKKNKQHDVISEDESQPMVFRMKEMNAGEKQHQLSINEMPSDEFLLHDCPDRDMYIDAVESFKALCEDVASLKSFDSLTGCGEIFADESASFIDIESSRVTFISKPSSIAASFQGGVEQLASPAKSESIDFSRLRGHMTSSATSVCSNVLSETMTSPVCHEINNEEMNESLSGDQVSNLSYNDLMSSSENIHDAESPMSTSDEGYYDSALDEGKNEVGNVRPFPRDSYSGDALYELFCDSCEKKPWPVQDCDLSVPSHNIDNPTSLYSFCVGSEENMASQPALGLDGEDSLDNTWKGRECLLKLCDTELSLTIGMVNWLKKTGKITENDISDQIVTCSSKEPIDMSNEQGNSAEETTATSGDNKRETFLHCESVITEPTDHVNSMIGNIDPLSNTFALHPKSTIGSDESTSEKNASSVTHLDYIALHNLSPKQSILINIIAYKNQLELSSPYTNKMFFCQMPNFIDILSFENHLDPLKPLSLQCLTYSVSENNRWLPDILQLCAADIPSLEVLFGNERILHSMVKIMRPYEIAINIKNAVEKLSPIQQTLQSITENGVNKNTFITDTNELQQANRICRTEFDQDFISNQQCIIKTSRLLPKERQTSKDAGKPGFRPLFKSIHSSVISRCSSVLYRVHNSEDAVIFFDKKYSPLPSSNDDPAQDSTTSSKYTKDGFLTSTTFTRENGLLLTKNKKWSI
ncbi:APC membrane recruitment protein 3 [Rhinoderma darwinii]|uniref:APC membrane recruitment protein 3 n=1 Tax=Rhinoderma darwinii TaxID=43563 RepID=UPI003F6677BF